MEAGARRELRGIGARTSARMGGEWERTGSTPNPSPRSPRSSLIAREPSSLAPASKGYASPLKLVESFDAVRADAVRADAVRAVRRKPPPYGTSHPARELAPPRRSAAHAMRSPDPMAWQQAGLVPAPVPARANSPPRPPKPPRPPIPARGGGASCGCAALRECAALRLAAARAVGEGDVDGQGVHAEPAALLSERLSRLLVRAEMRGALQHSRQAKP